MKKSKFLSEFKEFIMRGNVMDMAVGVIVGGAFQKIVSSLVDDILMPVITKITGGIDFSQRYVPLDGSDKIYATVQQANDAGVATLNYGMFITTVINFILMAFVIFSLVKALNSLNDKASKMLNAGKEAEPEAAPTTKICPFCKSEIPIDATRCRFCTSELTK